MEVIKFIKKCIHLNIRFMVGVDGSQPWMFRINNVKIWQIASISPVSRFSTNAQWDTSRLCSNEDIPNNSHQAWWSDISPPQGRCRKRKWPETPLHRFLAELAGRIVLISNRKILINYGNEPKIYGIRPKNHENWPINREKPCIFNTIFKSELQQLQFRRLIRIRIRVMLC